MLILFSKSPFTKTKSCFRSFLIDLLLLLLFVIIRSKEKVYSS
jgi:hypothetical protein